MYTNIIEGKYVNLRIATEDDAEFTLAVRQNESKNKFIPMINSNIENQKQWIRKQYESDDCYFFIVERKSGEKIGTFSLYNINGDEAESGRLVMQGNQLESLETGVLFSMFSFDIANMKIVRSMIYPENNAALGYSNRLGGIPVGETIESNTGRKVIIYQATKESFTKQLPKLKKIIDHFNR